MASRPVMILGGGGSGVIVAQAIMDMAAGGGDLHVLGYLNDVVPVGSLIEGLPVLGKFENWMPDGVSAPDGKTPAISVNTM